jgi:hypothetical protein
MEKYANWIVPHEYIKHYIFLMVSVLFLIPTFFEFNYTLRSYLINIIWADYFFYKWSKVSTIETKAKKRKRKFLGD